MFHNMLVPGVTPICKTNEIHHWDNQPFYRKSTEDGETVKKDKINKTIKKKRFRTYFSTEQLRELERVFSMQRYINAVEREELVKSLGINSKCVKVWFQNRRMKEKKSIEYCSDYGDTDAHVTLKTSNRNRSIKKKVPIHQQDQLNSNGQAINSERYEIQNQFSQYQPQIDVSDVNYRLTPNNHHPCSVQSDAHLIHEAPNEFNSRPSVHPFYHEQFHPQTYKDLNETAADTAYSLSTNPASEDSMATHTPTSVSSISSEEPSSEIRSNWFNFNIGEFITFK